MYLYLCKNGNMGLLLISTVLVLVLVLSVIRSEFANCDIINEKQRGRYIAYCKPFSRNQPYKMYDRTT